MKFRVSFTLIFHIRAYHRFITMLANGGSKVALCPELSSPQLLLHIRTFLEHLPRTQAFDQPHQVGNAVRRNRLNQKMDMILIRTHFQKMNLVTFLDLLTNVRQRPVNLFVEDCTPILRRKNKVIQQNTNIVAFMQILAHLPSLRPKGRGIEPEVIKIIVFLDANAIPSKIGYNYIHTISAGSLNLP